MHFSNFDQLFHFLKKTVLLMEEVTLDDGSWQPLLQFVYDQREQGQRFSLMIRGPHEHICDSVLKQIAHLVELEVDWLANDVCPFGCCMSSDEEL